MKLAEAELTEVLGSISAIASRGAIVAGVGSDGSVPGWDRVTTSPAERGGKDKEWQNVLIEHYQRRPCWWHWESKRTGRGVAWNCWKASAVSVGVGYRGSGGPWIGEACLVIIGGEELAWDRSAAS